MAGGSNGPPELNGAQYVYPTRTLAEVRADVYAGLGFIDPLANVPKKALSAIRDDIIATLGFPDPQTNTATRTLLEMRTELMRRLGFSVQATNPPPGMGLLLDAIINHANQTVFQRIELDLGSQSPPAQMVGDSDPTSNDVHYLPVLDLATAEAKAHYKQDDAKLYLDMSEKFYADKVRSRPPNLTATLTSMIVESQQVAYRRYESGVDVYSLSPFSADSDLTTIDYQPVQALATGRAKAAFGQKDASLYLDQYERYMNDAEKRFPSNARSVCTLAVANAQKQLYWRYSMLRNEMWFSWDTVIGQRFYDVPKVGADTLEFRKISWVGFQDSSTWLPMSEGIDPLWFTQTTQGPPIAYELGSTLEIWPEPEKQYTIWLKGHIGLQVFEADNDATTIDPHPVFLMALANAKQHYKQPDAPSIFRQLEVHIGNLNAGSFGLKRFIPAPPEPVRCQWPVVRATPRATWRGE